MGCSNPHPHGQIWSSSSIPQEPALEQAAQASYRQEKDSCLLCDYLALESAQEERLVCGNAHFIALVPFWAVWPFETMILGRRHTSSLADLTGSERDALANLLKRLTIRYDNLFEVSFPYTMGIHQKPTDGDEHPEWHLHLHFYPPLLRSATVRKFMVGYEMLANPQRDLSPESAAARLRALAEVRFDQR
jgi:UDPglucose--hexose-1-phosphate uridylyltransferase